MYSVISRLEQSHGSVHYDMTEQDPYRGGSMNNREMMRESSIVL
jgi:hypothetical protein